MGGVRPNASENGQINPSAAIRAARGADAGPHLATVLREGRKSVNIYASSGFIWRIPVKHRHKINLHAYLMTSQDRSELLDELEKM